MFWRPLQKLRAKFQLIPSAETEVVAQVQLLNTMQIAALAKRMALVMKNFREINDFMELTNTNTKNMDTNMKNFFARLQAVEKVLRMRQGDEPDDGSYVQ